MDGDNRQPEQRQREKRTLELGCGGFFAQKSDFFDDIYINDGEFEELRRGTGEETAGQAEIRPGDGEDADGGGERRPRHDAKHSLVIREELGHAVRRIHNRPLFIERYRADPGAGGKGCIIIRSKNCQREIFLKKNRIFFPSAPNSCIPPSESGKILHATIVYNKADIRRGIVERKKPA